MRMQGGHQERVQRPQLKLQGLHRGHAPLRVPADSCTLCSVARPAPQPRVMKRPLFPVARRLEPLKVHEASQARLPVQQFLEDLLHPVVVATDGADEVLLKDVDATAGLSPALLECGPTLCSVAHPLPQVEQGARTAHQPLTEVAGAPAAFNVSLDRRQQMGPAEMATRVVHPEMARAVVRDQVAGEPIVRQLPGHLGGVVAHDLEHRHRQRGGESQPGADVSLAPAGFVRVSVGSGLHVLAGCLHRFGQRGAGQSLGAGVQHCGIGEAEAALPKLPRAALGQLVLASEKRQKSHNPVGQEFLRNQGWRAVAPQAAQVNNERSAVALHAQ